MEEAGVNLWMQVRSYTGLGIEVELGDRKLVVRHLNDFAMAASFLPGRFIESLVSPRWLLKS